MTVALCAWMAAARGVVLLSSQQILTLFGATAIAAALAAAMISAGPRVPAAIVIALAASLSSGWLLLRLEPVVTSVGNEAAAAVLRRWTPWMIPVLLAACFLVAYGGFNLRDRLHRIGAGSASEPKCGNR